MTVEKAQKVVVTTHLGIFLDLSPGTIPKGNGAVVGEVGGVSGTKNRIASGHNNFLRLCAYRQPNFMLG
jgi:hypothetical protein